MNTLLEEKDIQSNDEETLDYQESSSIINKGSEVKQDHSLIVLCVVFVVMGVISAFLIRGSIRVGAKAMWNGYSEAYESKKEETYNAIYQNAFENAEHNYHVTNRISISIGDLQETADLEVLKVTDVEYVVDSDSNSGNSISAWLEVPGEGVFVVNLHAADFIIDETHALVRVRAPFPQLKNVSINHNNVKKLLFKDDRLIGNGSYKEGEDLAKAQYDIANTKIVKEFSSNQYFYNSAKKAAENTIRCLVKQLNPSIPDLIVEVEFF